MDNLAWDHVLDQHVEMSEYLADTMATIARPHHHEPDTRPGRERYFRQGGPSRWIRVVTEFKGEFDRVVRTFPQSNDPRVGSQRR
jgi:hypothetical protein